VCIGGGVALGLCWGLVLSYKVQMPVGRAIEHYILVAIEEKCTLKQLKVRECSLIEFNLTAEVDVAGAGWHAYRSRWPPRGWTALQRALGYLVVPKPRFLGTWGRRGIIDKFG